MNESPPDHLRIEYIKSNQFRVVHADGAYGGPGPGLGIFLAFYSERLPIVKVVEHEVTPEGRLGPEIKEKRQSKEGVIREVEVGIALSVDVAKALALWLQEKIHQVEDAQTKIQLLQSAGLTKND